MASGTIERIVSPRSGKVTWRARFSFESDTGRQHRSKTFKTKREAEAWLTARQHELRSGDYVELIPATLREVAGIWLERRRRSVQSSTWKLNERAWRVWVEPEFGSRQVRSISPSEIQALYDRIAASGRSYNTVFSVHVFLKLVFRMCVADGYLKVDPTRFRTLPGRSSAKGACWTAEQANQFLQAIAEDELEALWRLLVSTGIRVGEALVLTWNDLDTERRLLRINKTLRADFDGRLIIGQNAKTKASNRMVILPASTVMALHRHRGRIDSSRAVSESAWVDQNLIFPNLQTGDVRSPGWIRERLRRLAKQAGVPPVTPHHLRHTAATLMLAAGVHAKVVQEQLGHANISITLDLYGHVTTGMKDAAATAMDGVLGSSLGAIEAEKQDS
jgi:integrase